MVKFKKYNCILTLLSIISIIIALMAIICTGFNFVYIKTYVKGLSMYPTLNANVSDGEQGDKIYINRFAKSKLNDIVVLDVTDNPDFPNSEYIIKRVIALEGDVVNIEFDNDTNQYNLIVNGNIVYSKPSTALGYNTYNCLKSYIQNNENDSSRINENGIIIKSGEVFLLGDNWNISKDSSLVGPFKYSDIVGPVDIIVHKGENSFIKILKGIFT